MFPVAAMKTNVPPPKKTGVNKHTPPEQSLLFKQSALEMWVSRAGRVAHL